MKQVCLTRKFLLFFSFFLPKSKNNITLLGEQSARGEGKRHTDTHSAGVGRCTFKHTVTDESFKISSKQRRVFSFIRPQHYCVTHSNTKDTSRDIHGRESPPVLRPSRRMRHTAVCLEFSFLGSVGLFLVNWLKLAALHRALGPSPPLSEPCIGPGGRVLQRPGTKGP